MTTFFIVLPAAALLLAVVAASQLAVVVFRNPFRPAWARREWVTIAAALLITTSLTFASGVTIAAGTGAGLGILPAIGLTIFVAAGGGYGIARLFEVGERLRRADAGQSPFALGGRAAWLPRPRRLGGGADA